MDAVALPVLLIFTPPFAEDIDPLTLSYEPRAVPLILTLTEQEPFAGMVPPAGDPNTRVVTPVGGAHSGSPLQVVVADGRSATCKPEGNASVNVTSVKATELEFPSVNVNMETPLTAIESGENALVIVGGVIDSFEGQKGRKLLNIGILQVMIKNTQNTRIVITIKSAIP